MIPKNSLLGALPILAQALGRKYGVRVEIGGTQAFTDGQTIHLPSLPLEDTGALEVLANGYLDHEAAHVRLTDFTALQGRSVTPLEQAFTNILEDLRVDLRMGETYPGCLQNTRRLDAQLLRDGDYAVPEADAHPGAVLGAYLLNRGRQIVVGVEAMAELADQTEAVFRSRFPPGLATRLSAALYQAPRLQSTADVVALAGELVRMVEAAAEHPDPPPANAGDPHAPNGDSPPAPHPAGGNAGSPDGADAPGAGSAPPPANADAAQTADGAGGPGDNPASAGNQAPGTEAPMPGADESGAGRPPSTHPAPGAADPAAALREALAAQPSDLPLDRGQVVGGKLQTAARAADGPVVELPAEEGAPGGSPGAALMLSGPPVDLGAIRAQSARLRARLQGLVQASRLERSHAARTGARLDTRQLHRLAIQDTRIFTTRRERPAVDTAVLLIIDRSGSMKRRLGIARSAVLAAALALESIPRVQVATGAFPTDDRLGLAVLTPFGARVERTLEEYRFQVDGGTPLSEALLAGARLLAQRRETRKILLVATDGDPDAPTEAKGIIDWLSRAGVEMLGLGILCAVDGLFPTAQRINDLTELAPALFGLLQDRLN